MLYIQVPYSANKAQLKWLLCAKLLEQGVLHKPAAEAAVGDMADDAPVAKMKAAEVAPRLTDGVESQSVTDPLMGAGVTTENLHLNQQIKEAEARSKQLEVQAMHLRIRALELEKEAPVASSPVSLSGHSSIYAPAFDISQHIALVLSF